MGVAPRNIGRRIWTKSSSLNSDLILGFRAGSKRSRRWLLKRLLRLLAVPAILATFALTSLSCGDDDDDDNPMNPGPGTADVTITIAPGSSQAGAGAYSPSPANMTVGHTVRWVNNDNMLHTATHTSA